jgi:hypothetical protein
LGGSTRFDVVQPLPEGAEATADTRTFGGRCLIDDDGIAFIVGTAISEEWFKGGAGEILVSAFMLCPSSLILLCICWKVSALGAQS